MSKSLIKERGEISVHGSVQLSNDPQLLNRLGLLSICTANEITIKTDLTYYISNPINELIRFIGGNYLEKKGLIYQVIEINTVLIPQTIISDLNLRYLAMMAILGRKNEAGMEICDLDHYDTKLFEFFYKNIKLLPVTTKISKDYFIVKTDSKTSEPLIIDGRNLSDIEIYGFILFALGANISLTITYTNIDEYSLYILNKLKEQSIAEYTETQISINPNLPPLTFEDLPGSSIELLALLIITVYWKGDLSIGNIKQTQIIGLLNVLNRIGISYKYENETLRIWCDNNTVLSPINLEEKGTPGLIRSWVEILSLLSTQISGETNVRFINPSLFGEFFRENAYGLHIIPSINKTTFNNEAFTLIGPAKVSFENFDLNFSKSKILPLLLSLTTIESIELKSFELINDYLPELITKLIKLGLPLKVVEY